MALVSTTSPASPKRRAAAGGGGGESAPPWSTTGELDPPQYPPTMKLAPSEVRSPPTLGPPWAAPNSWNTLGPAPTKKWATGCTSRGKYKATHGPLRVVVGYPSGLAATDNVCPETSCSCERTH